jgi:beta-lactamase class A
LKNEGRKRVKRTKGQKLIQYTIRITVIFFTIFIIKSGILFATVGITSGRDFEVESKEAGYKELSYQRFVDGSFWLFLEQTDELPIGMVGQEFVSVIEEDGEWLKINTRQGEMWMSLSFTPSTAELDELLAPFDNSLSVHFENMETGFVYQFNPYQVYPSASVTKAVHALTILKKAEQGLINLDEIHTYTYEDYRRDSNVFLNNPFQVGRTFSTRELLTRSMNESHDASTLALIGVFGLEAYMDFVRGIGGNESFIGPRIMDSFLTVQETGLFARAIFDYLESGGVYSDMFRDFLLDNYFPFIVSDYPIASKTGWFSPYAWHDMSIVYAPSPYVLVVLSAREGWSFEDYGDFFRISMAFQEFNDRWFFRVDPE